MREGATFFRAAQASGEHWGGLVKAVLTALGPLPADLNFGLVYVTMELAEDLSSIATFLRETTPIKQWSVSVVEGVIGPIGVTRHRAALAVMVASLPEQSFVRFDGWAEPGRSRFLARQQSWLAEQDLVVGLVHGDARRADLPALLQDLSIQTGAYLVGGAVPLLPGGLAGVLLGEPLEMVTGLTQGCQPLGGPLRVTEAQDDVIMAIDGRPALDVMKEVAGQEIAQDLRRAAGVIHVGLPVAGADRADYLVRPLTAIDPTRGWVAVAGQFAVGDPILFVRHDTDAAVRDMTRMLIDLAKRSRSKRICGGVYVTCVARGAGLFETDETEITMIKNALGEFPLIGLVGHGEFCHDRLYGYSAVLLLVLA